MLSGETSGRFELNSDRDWLTNHDSFAQVPDRVPDDISNNLIRNGIRLEYKLTHHIKNRPQWIHRTRRSAARLKSLSRPEHHKRSLRPSVPSEPGGDC